MSAVLSMMVDRVACESFSSRSVLCSASLVIAASMKSLERRRPTQSIVASQAYSIRKMNRNTPIPIRKSMTSAEMMKPRAENRTQESLRFPERLNLTTMRKR